MKVKILNFVVETGKTIFEIWKWKHGYHFKFWCH